jgi:hypothetical protein
MEKSKQDARDMTKYEAELDNLDSIAYEQKREEGVTNYVYSTYFLAADIEDLQAAFDFYKIPAKIFKKEVKKSNFVKEYFSEKLYKEIKIIVNGKHIDFFVGTPVSIPNWKLYSYHINKFGGLPKDLALYIAIESKDLGIHKGFINFEDAQKYLCDKLKTNKSWIGKKAAPIGSKKPAIKTAKPTDKAKATGSKFSAAGKPKPTAKPEAKKAVFKTLNDWQDVKTIDDALKFVQQKSYLKTPNYRAAVTPKTRSLIKKADERERATRKINFQNRNKPQAITKEDRENSKKNHHLFAASKEAEQENINNIYSFDEYNEWIKQHKAATISRAKPTDKKTAPGSKFTAAGKPKPTAKPATNAAKLEQLKKQLEALDKQTDYTDELGKHFHGGKVGFLNGAGKKKFNNSINKSIDNAKRRNKIAEEIKMLENKIAYVKPVELKAAGFRIGDIVEWSISKNKYVVIKINKKTVTIKNTTSDYKEAVNPNHLKLIKAAPAAKPTPAAKSAWTGSKTPAMKTTKTTDKKTATGSKFSAAGKPKPTAKPEAKPTTQPTSKPAKPRAKSEPKPEVIEKRLEGKIETRKRRARVAITEAHNLSVELEKLQRRKKIVNI